MWLGGGLIASIATGYPIIVLVAAFLISDWLIKTRSISTNVILFGCILMASVLGFRHGYTGTAAFLGCPLLFAGFFLACRHYVLGSFSKNPLKPGEGKAAVLTVLAAYMPQGGSSHEENNSRYGGGHGYWQENGNSSTWIEL